MKKIVILAFFVSLISINLVSASESLFHYDSEALNAEFSELIIVENAIISNNNSFEELLITNESLRNLIDFQDDDCSRGRADAAIRYTGTSAMWGSLCLTGGCNPLFGVILVLTTKDKIKDNQLNLADATLLNNTDYINCYRTTALDIKKKKLWTGFGIGTGIYAIFLIYSLSMQSM